MQPLPRFRDVDADEDIRDDGADEEGNREQEDVLLKGPMCLLAGDRDDDQARQEERTRCAEVSDNARCIRQARSPAENVRRSPGLYLSRLRSLSEPIPQPTHAGSWK